MPVELPPDVPPVLVVGRLYEGPGAEHRAKLAFDAVHAHIQRVHHCSVWRSRADGEPVWFVLVADQTDGHVVASRAEWFGGAPYEIPESLERSLVLRRFRAALDDFARTGNPETRTHAHFGLGAEIDAGGNLRIRVAGEDG